MKFPAWPDQFDKRDLGTFWEPRAATFELRANEDGTFGVHGYASVTESPYEMYGGPEAGGWNETIARGAFAKTLAEQDDVRFLVNHDGIPLARTVSGTLHLEEDRHGLLMEAPALDGRNPTAAELRSAMERGDLDQMSFAFRVMRQEWNGDYTERRITEVKLFDVAAVTYPANPATVIGLRRDPDPAEQRTGMPRNLAAAIAAQLRAHQSA